jgi:predicted RNA-binding protein YlqC (UPF0109 family)
MTSKAGEQIQEFVERLARAVVDQPDNVRVNVLESGTMVVVEVTAAKEDIGKIIGREGRNAQSLRVLLGALGTKLGKKALLEIVDL